LPQQYHTVNHKHIKEFTKGNKVTSFFYILLNVADREAVKGPHYHWVKQLLHETAW